MWALAFRLFKWAVFFLKSNLSSVWKFSIFELISSTVGTTQLWAASTILQVASLKESKMIHGYVIRKCVNFDVNIYNCYMLLIFRMVAIRSVDW